MFKTIEKESAGIKPQLSQYSSEIILSKNPLEIESLQFDHKKMKWLF